MSGHNGQGMPDSVYDEAVRVLLKCPATHTHITIESLRRVVDDMVGPGVFRAAVESAWASGRISGWDDGRESGYADGYDNGHEAAWWAASHPDD